MPVHFSIQNVFSASCVFSVVSAQSAPENRLRGAEDSQESWNPYVFSKERKGLPLPSYAYVEQK